MLPISPYITLNLIAAFTLFAYANFQLRRSGLKFPQILLVTGVLILLFAVGSRLLYGILYFPKIWANPSKLFEIKLVNFSLYGGLLLSLLGWHGVTRYYKLPFLALTDKIIPALGIAVAISKMGCFFNGCCYGIPTNMPWGMVFERADQTPLTKAFGSSPFIKMISGAVEVSRHPTQLYEVFFALLAAGVAYFLVSRASKGVKAGVPTICFVIVLTVGRWISFAFREFPSATAASNFIRGPVTYGLVIIISLFLLYRLDKGKKLRR